MTSNPIESILRSAPSPVPPTGLKQNLQGEIRLEPPKFIPTERFWKRRWPIVIPGITAVALATVVAIQQAEIGQLETELQTLSSNPPTNATDASSASGAVSEPMLDPRIEIEQLRARLAALQGTLGAESALMAETERLNAELADVLAALPPEVAAVAEMHQRAQRIRCVNNLKQLGLSVRIFANEHKENFPPDLNSIVPFVGDGMIFVCPSDAARSSSVSSGSTEVFASNSSYEFTAPGPGAYEIEPNRVCLICPIHRNVTLCDGSVQQLTLERFAGLVRRDGKIYLEPDAAVGKEPNP